MRVGWPVFRHFRIARASHALSSLQSTICTVHFTLHTPLYTLHCTRYTPHSALRTRHFTHYILHSTLYTLHFTLYTPYLTLYSLHSSPTTRHQHPSATFTLRAPLLSLTPTSSPINALSSLQFQHLQPQPRTSSPDISSHRQPLLCGPLCFPAAIQYSLAPTSPPQPRASTHYTLHLHSPPRNSNPYHVFSPSVPFSIDLF